MKIAIVNDMNMAVETLKRVLMTVPDYTLAWVAKDGAEAVSKCAQDTPDLILMDLIMPIMDGVEATREIMKNSPCAILIVTASVGKNSAKVFDAMGYGALDAVSTPVLGPTGNPEAAKNLLSKITTISKLIGKSSTTNKSSSSRPIFSTPTAASSRLPSLVAIGSSTGGPNALSKILSNLPANFAAPIVIVQHVDEQFTPSLVEWLNQQTPLKVELATEGDRKSVV